MPEPPTELDAAAIAGAWADGLPLGQIGALSQVRTELMVARLRRSGIDLSTRG